MRDHIPALYESRLMLREDPELTGANMLTFSPAVVLLETALGLALFNCPRLMSPFDLQRLMPD